jgi:membrane fusion protein (multidrug efflux system)
VVPASIEARETTVVAARLLARIEAIEVRAGDYVEAGQLLIQLQQDELEARSGQAEQGVRSLEARLDEARQTLARTEELHDASSSPTPSSIRRAPIR